MSTNFIEAKIKFNRAIEHQNALMELLEAHAATKPQILFKVRDKQSGEISLLHTISTPMPDAASNIFYDAIHSYRASLDILANELVKINGRAPDGVYFPFAKSESLLPRQIKEKFKNASAPAKNLIIGLRPYKGGNAILADLHALDIQGKHTSVIKTATNCMYQIDKFIESADGVHTADFSQQISIPIAPKLYDDKFPHVEILGEVKNYHVEFIVDQGQPFEFNTLNNVLKTISDEVRSIIQKFDDLYPGAGDVTPDRV